MNVPPGPVMLSVFDVSGRTVQTRSVLASRAGTVSLDLRDLAAGIYLVQLDADGYTETNKLIIER